MFKPQVKSRKFSITNEPYVYDDNFPLISINLASNRPDQITEFVENIHSTCENKNAYEIIVKIDTEDTAMIKCVAALSEKYGVERIRPLIGPKKLGPWSLWEFYNEMYSMAHEKVYFMWLPSDEVRIATHASCGFHHVNTEGEGGHKKTGRAFCCHGRRAFDTR